MNTASALTSLGFPVQRVGLATSLREFQASWSLGTALKVDGIAGPFTQSALSVSLGKLSHGQPTMSRYFSFSDAACKCDGVNAGCKGVHAPRTFVALMDQGRNAYGKPIVPRSWYRCVKHNSEVGGAPESLHIKGCAVDFLFDIRPEQIRGWHLFSGVEWTKVNHGNATHVDGRHLVAGYGGSATPYHPAIFEWKPKS